MDTFLSEKTRVPRFIITYLLPEIGFVPAARASEKRPANYVGMSWSAVRQIAGIQLGEPPRREGHLYPALEKISQLVCKRERLVLHRTVTCVASFLRRDHRRVRLDVLLRTNGLIPRDIRNALPTIFSERLGLAAQHTANTHAWPLRIEADLFDRSGARGHTAVSPLYAVELRSYWARCRK